MLRQWVQTSGDAAAIEAEIVVSRTNTSKLGTQRELLTVQQMVSRGYPKEKIDAICARGGLPDPDCPNIPSLYRYWVQTSCVLKDTEEVKQQTSATVKASIDGAGMGALLDGPTGAGVRQALPSGGLDQIMAAAQQAQPQGQGPDLSFALFL